MTKNLMQSLAKRIDAKINGSGPKTNGFVLLAFPLNKPEGQRVNYVSNCDRADIIAALKEIIARFEGRGHDAPSSIQ